MNYKGLKILANIRKTMFFALEDENISNEVYGIHHSDQEEYWYSVVDKNNSVIRSFETIEECKDYIDGLTGSSKWRLKRLTTDRSQNLRRRNNV